MTMRGRWEVLLAMPGIVLSFSSGVRAQSCEPAAANVISVQGDVEVSGHDRAHWQDVQLNQVLCGGQQVRLMAKSRAVLQLPNETLIHLDEGSVFTLRAIEPDKPAWLDLLRGALHIISRVPRALNIRTPFVNAGIEGTEFALQVGNAETALWVYEGRVRFSNTLGQLLIASGEAAAAARGRPPERRIVIKPRQAVEWALYYPPLLDSRPESYPEALRPAVLAYRRNDFTAAFAALDGVPEGARDARYHTLRAGLLLSVGRVPEAEGDLTSAQRLDPKNGTAYALRSVIAVVRNEQEEALKLAGEAVRLAPGSATPYVARSYAEQSAFEIEKAQQSIKQASRLAPEDALVWARLSELELSRGDLDAALESARKAEQLDPGLSRTQSVLGFAYLTRIEVDAAKRAFERAMALDPADPLPRLGLGLAKIRDGDLDNGTKEIEIAAALDPNNSLVRSYLGKAYFEQKRSGLASTEFEQAKLLDPKDPTPWFYDAIHKQTTNRPVEALHDLQRSIDLNDNRAVYRSRLLLDEDLAARSAALGRIYRDLGFEQRALVEGWKSLNTDPSDYSAHRLLADSYSGLQRHKIARVSELLQSQLLQPMSITPLQPQLAESDLRILEGAGPAQLAFNEFNPLFTRNRVTLQASGLVAGNDTYADELTHAGLWGRYTYSLGQFHYETEGYRDNNDLEHDIYNAFAQVAISPSTNLQIELRHQGTESGDLSQNFDTASFSPNRRIIIDRETARLGFHHRLGPHEDIITSFIYRDLTTRILQQFSTSAVFSPIPGVEIPLDIKIDFDRIAKTGAYSAELQYQRRTQTVDLVLGAGHMDRDRNDVSNTLTTTTFGGVPEPPDRELASSDVDGQHTNAYAYANIDVVRNLSATVGLAYERFDSRNPNLGRDRWSPKLGATWQLLPGTTLRAAWFKYLKRPFVSDQTIEPTQVAGFNQFFDDTDGTETERYGVAIDQSFGPRWFAGIELSWRDIVMPINNSEQIVVSEERDEESHRAYLYWTPTESIALGAEYFLEKFDRTLHESILEGTDPVLITTHRLPLTLSYYRPNGFFARLTAHYVNQDIEVNEAEAIRSEQSGEITSTEINAGAGSTEFWVVDVAIGYRLPNRWGIVTVGAKNFLDNEIRFQDTSNLDSVEPFSALFQPDQVVFAQFTLSF